MPQTCFFSSCDEVFLWTILVALEVNVHQSKGFNFQEVYICHLYAYLGDCVDQN